MGRSLRKRAIKLLGTNGGGFFNANAAHPYENPTALSNLLEMILILLSAPVSPMRSAEWSAKSGKDGLSGAMVILSPECFRRFLRRERPATRIFAMFESIKYQPPPKLAAIWKARKCELASPIQPCSRLSRPSLGGGAVNAMHDSFTPLGGGMVMANMMLDEVIVGAPGSGLFGMLLFALVAVLVAGLMVGRTPEYLGKKIQSAEVKMAVMALLVVPATILVLTSVAAALPAGLAGLSTPDRMGFRNCSTPIPPPRPPTAAPSRVSAPTRFSST